MTSSTHTIDYALDADERAMMDEILSGESKPVANQKEEVLKAKQAAQSFVKATRKKINIRIPEYNLTRLKQVAEHKGLPYQTLINSVLEQYLNENAKTLR